MTHTIKEARAAFRAIGYKIRIRTYSDFCGATILAPAGEVINGGRMFTTEELAAFRAQHVAALALVDVFKGKTFDGDFRIVF